MSVASTPREQQKNQFLKDAGIKVNQNIALPADASARFYERLITTTGQSFILMDCPLSYASIKPFVTIAKLLRENHIYAPNIYHQNEDFGFLLLEDLGDLTVRKLLQHDPEKITHYYQLIIDLLVQVQSITPPEYLIEHSLDRNLNKLKLFSKWYWLAMVQQEMPLNLEEQFLSEWHAILQLLPQGHATLVLGDFHIENLMYLPTQSKIGVLDFQDAHIGHHLYDLASLLHDARSFMPLQLRKSLLEYYINKVNLRYHTSEDNITLFYNILAASRNLQILGVFARKAVRDHVTYYLKNMLPTVLSYLDDNLKLPIFNNMSKFFPPNT